MDDKDIAEVVVALRQLYAKLKRDADTFMEYDEFDTLNRKALTDATVHLSRIINHIEDRLAEGEQR